MAFLQGGGRCQSWGLPVRVQGKTVVHTRCNRSWPWRLPVQGRKGRFVPSGIRGLPMAMLAACKRQVQLGGHAISAIATITTWREWSVWSARCHTCCFFVVETLLWIGLPRHQLRRTHHGPLENQGHRVNGLPPRRRPLSDLGLALSCPRQSRRPHPLQPQLALEVARPRRRPVRDMKFASKCPRQCRRPHPRLALEVARRPRQGRRPQQQPLLALEVARPRPPRMVRSRAAEFPGTCEVALGDCRWQLATRPFLHVRRRL